MNFENDVMLFNIVPTDNWSAHEFQPWFLEAFIEESK